MEGGRRVGRPGVDADVIAVVGLLLALLWLPGGGSVIRRWQIAGRVEGRRLTMVGSVTWLKQPASSSRQSVHLGRVH